MLVISEQQACKPLPYLRRRQPRVTDPSVSPGCRAHKLTSYISLLQFCSMQLYIATTTGRQL